MLKNKVPLFFLFAALYLLMFMNVYSQSSKKNILKTIIVDAGHGGTDAGAIAKYENSKHSKEKDITLAISKKLVSQLQKDLPDVKTLPTRTTDIFQHPTEKAKIANDLGGQLFICIHADTGPLKKGRRQIGSRTVTRYKVIYTGKGKKKRKKRGAPYRVVEPIYEYFILPQLRSGTSVWIFAPHKTSDKLKAIMDGGEDFEIETNSGDSTETGFDFNTPEGRNIANIYMVRFQKKSDRLATLVNDEVEQTGRPTLGVNQRQKGIWVLQATNMPAILVETGFINNPEDEAYLTSEKGQQELAEAISRAVIRYKTLLENPNKNNITTIQEKKEEQKVSATVMTLPDKRETKEVKVLQVNNKNVKIALFDDGEIDGDIVSIFFNKNMVVDKKILSDKSYDFSVNLEEGKTNELVMYAENLGSIPPNTALMVITDGTHRYEVRLSADFKNNASVRFELKNNN